MRPLLTQEDDPILLAKTEKADSHPDLIAEPDRKRLDSEQGDGDLR
jgi:hypothetical protein